MVWAFYGQVVLTRASGYSAAATVKVGVAEFKGRVKLSEDIELIFLVFDCSSLENELVFVVIFHLHCIKHCNVLIQIHVGMCLLSLLSSSSSLLCNKDFLAFFGLCNSDS